MAWMATMLTGLKLIHEEFLIWRDDVNRRASQTGQVMVLERMLNLQYLNEDKWASPVSPTADGGIYLVHQAILPTGYSWNEDENQPNEGFAYNEGESPITPPAHTVEYAYNEDEFVGQTSFIVMVPNSLTYNENEMRLRIDQYVQAGYTYAIDTY